MKSATITVTPTGKPCWSRSAAIGDYAGSRDKEDSTTEASEPYAAGWYRELHAMRGTAYTQAPFTLVDCENIAIARLSAAVWSRNPEKVRANATPLRADERLEYWTEVLDIVRRDDEERWQLRERAVASYKAGQGPTTANITLALQALLGDVFVSATSATGTSLSAPPAITYWPTINPGPSALSLGGGAWMSERANLTVLVTPPTQATLSDFYTLVNVHLFNLLDGFLPAWATFDWTTGVGFIVDSSLLDFDGV